MTLAYKGIKINYQTTGDGTPLVFLHGFLENATMWNTVTPHFTDTHRCITIDLLGHGKTGCLGYIHTMEDMAIAIKYVLEYLEIHKATIIGHSMGGYVALAMADLSPDHIDGLVLLNSTSFPDNKERKQNRSRAIQIVKKNPSAFTNMAIENLFAEENRSKFPKEIKTIKDQASKTPLQGIISALEGMKIREDRRTILTNFKKPKILIAGKQDPILPYDLTRQEANECKTDLVSLDGGHMSYIENTAEFLKTIFQFLK